MTRTMNVTVQVSHVSNTFQYHYSGDVKDTGGTIEVPPGAPVKIQFTATEGQGVDDVSFADDAKKAIRIGPKDDKTCPPVASTGEFEDEQHGNSKKILSVKDKCSTKGDFQYALFFQVTKTGGKPQAESSDPMIINR